MRSNPGLAPMPRSMCITEPVNQPRLRDAGNYLMEQPASPLAVMVVEVR